jgi:hypothetical protein
MVAIAHWAHPKPRRSKLYRSATEFSYAHGDHLMAKTTPSPDVVDDDMSALSEAEVPVNDDKAKGEGYAGRGVSTAEDQGLP